jgi:hypothetical protein
MRICRQLSTNGIEENTSMVTSKYDLSSNYRNSSFRNTVHNMMHGNIRRSAKSTKQTKSQTRSILKHWIYNIYSIKGWSFSKNSVYRLSNRTCSVRTLLDYHIYNEADHVPRVWNDNQSQEVFDPVSRRTLVLGLGVISWQQERSRNQNLSQNGKLQAKSIEGKL